jgi:hypothetical protein
LGSCCSWLAVCRLAYGRQTAPSIAVAHALLGTSGGIGQLIKPAGLFAERWRRDLALIDHQRTGMEVAFAGKSNHACDLAQNSPSGLVE